MTDRRPTVGDEDDGSPSPRLIPPAASADRGGGLADRGAGGPRRRAGCLAGTGRERCRMRQFQSAGELILRAIDRPDLSERPAHQTGTAECRPGAGQWRVLSATVSRTQQLGVEDPTGAGGNAQASRRRGGSGVILALDQMHAAGLPEAWLIRRQGALCRHPEEWPIRA